MRILIAGTVVVVLGSLLFFIQRSDSTRSLIARCNTLQYKDSCYNDAVNEVFHTRGLAAAFDTLAAAYDADPSYLATCHAETHELGKAAYKEFHTSGKVELTQKTSYCGYGFYHGFMEELLYETNDYAEARKFCAYAGTAVPTPPGYSEGACYHGIGHGVTDGTEPWLWGSAQKMAAPGLALCAKVAGDDPVHRYRCDSGVFNSIALLYRDPKYKLDPKGDAFLLCRTVSFTTTEKEACYDQMNIPAMKLAGYDFATAIRSVENIPEDAYRKIAVRGISGMYFSNTRSRHNTFSAKEVSDVCATLGAEADDCITGVIGGIQEFGTPGAEYKDMFALCDSSELDAKFVATCYDSLISSTKWFYSDTIVQNVCADIPSSYRREACNS